MKIQIEGDNPRIIEVELMDETTDDGIRFCGLRETDEGAHEIYADGSRPELWGPYDFFDLVDRKEISLLEITEKEIERMESPDGFIEQAKTRAGKFCQSCLSWHDIVSQRLPSRHRPA